MDAERYLIIIGMPRAGTTSLFNWFSSHPGIAAAPVKQTNFFLDRSYPAAGSFWFNGGNIDDYRALFPADSSKVRLEASPDYLYGASAASIAENLPDSRLLVVLRDPVERAVSWYRYALQKGLLQDGVSFEEYINKQIALELKVHTPVHMRALDQNRIDRYLAPFRQHFGNRLLELRFEQLQLDPLEFVNSVCEFAELEANHFANFDFSPQNQSIGQIASRGQRNYYALRDKLEYGLLRSEKIRRTLKPINTLVKRIVSAAAPATEIIYEIEVSSHLREVIVQHANGAD